MQLVSSACSSLLEAMHSAQSPEFLQDVHVSMVALENAGATQQEARMMAWAAAMAAFARAGACCML